MIDELRHRILTPLAALVVLAILPLAGCGALTTLASLVPTLLFDSAQTTLLNAFAQPRVIASAGPDQLVLTGETVVLDGSTSGIRSGGSSFELSPTPPVAFAWSISSSPVPDQNNDGVVNEADFAAAGVRLVKADTPFPQFRAALPGVYVVQLTVTWTAPTGATLTGTDFAKVGVSAPAP